MTQTLQEQETILNMTADDRGRWHVFCDDPVMIRTFERIDAEFVRDVGVGKEFILRSDQVFLRKGKRKMSDEQRAAAVKRLNNSRTVSSSK